MPTLSFFPWLEVKAELRWQGFVVLPYQRGRLPDGPHQGVIDDILGPYLAGRGRPVEKAALLVIGDRELTDDLTEEQREEAFEFSDVLKMGGLSERKYDQFGYVNSSAFTLVIQNFGDSKAGVFIPVRMRYGYTGHYLTHGAYEVQQPRNTVLGGPAPIDLALVGALLAARGNVIWPRCSTALVHFTAANTDNEAVSERSELVEMVSAFESLLDQHNAKPLAGAFVKLWPQALGRLEAMKRPLSKRFGADWFILDAWLYDLYDARNESAHAGLGKTTTWSVQEHLFFGAIAFPLLLKRVLADAGFYQLTVRDAALRERFERLLYLEPFVARELGEPPPWKAILDEAEWKAVLDRPEFQAIGRMVEDALAGADFGTIPEGLLDRGEPPAETGN